MDNEFALKLESIDAWLGLTGPGPFLDANPDAAVIVNSDGLIFYANPKVAFVFGWGWPELIGEPIEKLIPIDRHERHREHIKRFFRNPESRQMGASKNLKIEGLNKFGGPFSALVDLQVLPTKIGIMALAFIRPRILEAAISEPSSGT